MRRQAGAAAYRRGMVEIVPDFFHFAAAAHVGDMIGALDLPPDTFGVAHPSVGKGAGVDVIVLPLRLRQECSTREL